MKIRCEVCEVGEAEVLCCADEAVLCWVCDEKVHAANKVSQKHQHVSLLKPPASSSAFPSSSHLPLCDVCQESNGYFFCLGDRAILCRQCDMSTHMAIASSYVSSHQRLMFSNSSLSNLPTYPEECTATMTLDIETKFTETTATSGEPHLATTDSWSLDDILGTDDFTSNEFSDMESSRITRQ
ncbi:hypothetical protein ACOSP7_008935 [Xanthoceras sorbifolium]